MKNNKFQIGDLVDYGNGNFLMLVLSIHIGGNGYEYKVLLLQSKLRDDQGGIIDARFDNMHNYGKKIKSKT